jgi:hypothetical protein
MSLWLLQDKRNARSRIALPTGIRRYDFLKLNMKFMVKCAQNENIRSRSSTGSADSHRHADTVANGTLSS